MGSFIILLASCLVISAVLVTFVVFVVIKLELIPGVEWPSYKNLHNDKIASMRNIAKILYTSRTSAAKVFEIDIASYKNIGDAILNIHHLQKSSATPAKIVIWKDKKELFDIYSAQAKASEVSIMGFGKIQDLTGHTRHTQLARFTGQAQPTQSLTRLAQPFLPPKQQSHTTACSSDSGELLYG